MNRDNLINLLREHFDMNDTYTYNLTRHKSAFGLSTMTIHDFQEITMENIEELADTIIKFWEPYKI